MKKSTLITTFVFVYTIGIIAQIKWKPNANNPVLEFEVGKWDNLSVSTPCVVKNWSGFHMYYTGSDGVRQRIGYAYSPDGVNWVKHPNPILDVGDSNAWDSKHVSHAVVIFDNNIFKMWYAGTNGTRGTDIGYAISQNGTDWIKSEVNPVMQYQTIRYWERNGIWPGFAQKTDTTFLMWYSGSNGYERISLAIGDDETNWTFYGNFPVINYGEISGKWDAHSRRDPGIVYFDSTYQLWFGGSESSRTRIGYAKSTNGIEWDIRNSPVFSPKNLESDSVFAQPTVIFDGKKYHMWYTFSRRGKPQKWIFYATSQDLTTDVAESDITPNRIQLAQNYPNPFNPKTAIQFSVSKKTEVSLVVFNLIGEKVATLVSRDIQTGEHIVHWQPNELPSGVYVYRLKAGTLSITKKMIYLK